ncbi:MAG: biotin attachment protein, partial [Salibacteraceae bacterium]|nr:biotin attachment protein [Salibacteraceae bacterium]
MLNISTNSVKIYIDENKYSTLKLVLSKSSGKVFLRLLSVFFGMLLILVFLPWTQNIQSQGNVTTLRP